MIFSDDEEAFASKFDEAIPSARIKIADVNSTYHTLNPMLTNTHQKYPWHSKECALQNEAAR